MNDRTPASRGLIRVDARRMAIAAVMAGLLAGLAPASAALAIPGTPTTTTVAWPANPLHTVDMEQAVEVTVTPAPTDGGTVTVWWNNNGTPTQQYTNSVDPVTGKSHVLLWNTIPMPVGSYEMSVAFTAGGTFLDSTSASHSVEVVLSQTSISLGGDTSPVLTGSDVHLTASAAGYTESIQLWDAFNGGAGTLIDTKTAENDAFGHYTASFTVPTPAIGSHVYTAVSAESVWFESATSDPRTIDVVKIPTQPSLSYLSDLKGGKPVSVRFDVNRPGLGLATGATGTATVKEGLAVLGTCELVDASCEFQMTLATGSHDLTLVYSGDATFAASQEDAPIDVPAEIVDATGVGVQYPTFYPYKDGYRDTVAIRGTRNESISVVIRIYNSSNKIVRTWSVAAGTGAYSVAWNGRTASGAALPSAKYKVVQTLTDAAHTVKAVTAYTTTSPKRLYTSSQTYTKSYTQATKRTSTWIAWTYTLPSATVYKTLVVSINGRDTHGTGGFGPQDFSYCSGAYWDPYCVTRWRTFPTTLTWKSFTANATLDRSGRTVRVYAWGGSGNTQVKYSRIKITYAILK